jgi:hypothetical protein
MLLFKRIIALGKDDTPADRRLGQRYCISPRFPLKALIHLVGRDEFGNPLPASDGCGRDWTGRLINISTSGARMQVPPAICARPGDRCSLKLDLEGHQLELKGSIAHLIERRDSNVYGLKLDAVEPALLEGYNELIELIAIGATFKPARATEPLDTHYLIEQYAGESDARIDVWRHCNSRGVAAFEFRLRDFRVRGYEGKKQLEFLSASEAPEAPVMPPEHRAEIHRLFHWVVPNLPTSIPADVRAFMQVYAA